MTNEYMGMILSLCGMIISVFSFQAKKKKMLLILQTVGSAFYMVSYIFADGGVAIWLNLIFLARNFIYMHTDKCSNRARYVICAGLCMGYVAIYVMSVIFGKLTFADCLWSTLPIIGAFFGTIAFADTNVNRLRALKSFDSMSWLAYNIHLGIGALGGILGEIFNLTSIVIALVRFSDKRQKKSSE